MNVCRVSGKLPNYGCSSVEAIDQDGFAVTKSQVYTDFFVKGSQPTTLCPLHPGGILADAGTLGIPTPVPTSGAAPPPANPGDDTIAVNPVPPLRGGTVTPPAAPRRGIWRRIFGGGRGGG